MADGLLTPKPAENIYSGVVSLRNLWVVIFLHRLNNQDIWGADIGMAQLEAEFDQCEGHILIFLNALYGLNSAGKR